MASITARKFWDNGTPLCDAWIEFANEEKKFELENLPGLETTIRQIEYTDAKSIWHGITKSIVSLNNASMKSRELTEIMKEDLLVALFNWQLVATGKQKIPSLNSKIVRIDASNFYEGNADWVNSEFSTNGQTWGYIRISSIPSQIQQKSKGSRTAILQAIQELSLGGLNFNLITRKAGAHRIRVKLGREYETGNGLSDVNLAKLIVEECGKKGICN